MVVVVMDELPLNMINHKCLSYEERLYDKISGYLRERN